jgi:peptidoglycan/LPS O-acetylase OafA/YrhL
MPKNVSPAANVSDSHNCHADLEIRTAVHAPAAFRETAVAVASPLVVAQGVTTQASQKPQKIESLESIRGIAALLVVFYHFPKWHPFLQAHIVTSGYLMVELFFVLSGFVIFKAYAQKLATARDLARFQFLRFGRLYPVHIIFLLAFLLIEVAKYLVQARVGLDSTTRTPFEENNFEAFVENIFLVQSVLPGRPLTFNYPSWSISVEFYTYLIFGLITLSFRQLKLYVFGVLALAALVMLAVHSTFGFENLMRCFAGFFIGCLTASFVRNSKTRFPRWASLVAVAAIVLFLELKTTKEFDVVIYFLTAALIASLVLAPKGIVNGILHHRVLTWLGAISYSVYMSHLVIIWASTQVFRVIVKRPVVTMPDGAITAQLSLFETLLTCASILAAVLIASTLIYNYVEKPMRERSRRLAARKLS